MLFACIYVPDFPAEAIMRAAPDLRDQAVAVVEGKPPLLTVVAANEHARSAGVEPGMTALQASARLAALATRRNGPHLFAIRHRSVAQELSAHAALADCARAFSPRVEECAAADTLWLELTGLERLFGPPAKIARDIARRASELGIEVNVGVAENLEAATCAARGSTGATVIAAGKEAERLAPLSTEVLLQSALILSQTVSGADVHPPFTAAKSAGNVLHSSAKKRVRTNTTAEQLSPTRADELLETLDRWGVRTFRALAALPEIAVSERLGAEGLYLLRLARGEGSRTLAATDSPLNFEEALDLEQPIEDLEALAFVLNRLIEQLCARLSARALSTNELHLRLELAPCADRDIRSDKMQTAEHGSTLIGPAKKEGSGQKNNVKERTTHNLGAVNSSDHPIVRSSDAYERSIHLPVPMLDGKTFLRLWQLELRGNPPSAPVTKIHLRAEPVQPRHMQGGLFLPTAPEPERLEVTLARIANVVGENKNADSAANYPPPDNRGSLSRRIAGTAFDPGSRLSRTSPVVIPSEARNPYRHHDIPDAIGAPASQSPDDTMARWPDRYFCSSDHPIVRSSVSLRVGSPEILDTHRPGAFRMKRFSPTVSGDNIVPRPMTAPTPPNSPNDRDSAHVGNVTALRVFRPPLPISVGMTEGKPTNIALCDASTALGFEIAGKITWCAGPWRTSGEWWNKPWSRDEWDVAVETTSGRLLCRVHRNTIDDAWSMEGVYD